MSRESGPVRESDLTSSVSNALAADERTAQVPIEVIAQRGLITLKGEVESIEVRRVAEEIAAAQPGVIEVINDLEVVPDARDDDLVDVNHFAYYESRPPVIPEQDVEKDQDRR